MPAVGKSPTPEIKTQPRGKTIAETLEPEAKPAGSDEIKPPIILPETRSLPTAEIKPPQQKIADGTNEVKPGREILIKEVLQLSRNSLAEQGVEPEPEVWKRFAGAVIEELPDREADENQKQLLESFQKYTLPSKQISLEGKSSLEATHTLLKLALKHQRDKFVKSILAGYEKEIAAERDAAAAKPGTETERRAVAMVKSEIEVRRGDQVKPQIIITEPDIEAAKSEIKTAASEVVKAAKPEKPEQLEKVSFEQVKQKPVIRNFETVEREELIRELVAAASDEARTWKGADLTYRQEKQLTRMYRRVGDRKPLDKQITDLNNLQERLSEPLPEPKNFIEATVLRLDNLTDAEKSVGLRGQLTKLDELLEGEEAERSRIEEALGRSAGDDVFGRTDSYFTQQLHQIEIKPDDKSYFELTREAQQRKLLPAYSANEEIQARNMQDALYQMGVANALQEQIKRSLEEQGIKIAPMAQRIINITIDSWATQQPGIQEYKNVELINRREGGSIIPDTKLEANAYALTHIDERERDKFSSALAAAAGEKAAEMAVTRAKNLKRASETTQENSYEDGQSRGRSM